MTRMTEVAAEAVLADTEMADGAADKVADGAADKAPRGDRVDRTWTVGQLAVDLGVTTRTLRHYEAEGLVSPARSGNGRVYDHRDRARLRLILRGKRFGMSLPEIREIVGMYDGAATSERRQLETLLSRLSTITADLRARQQDLARTLREVDEVAAQCQERLDQLP
ncbi:MAG: MerR family DNA-binding transcriptional regulator [Actinomycetota bacterium]|nr:MerR family DNA-binding transcriptional regulator [Actinomycetota bacterium]MDQ2956625.1 MerR family DNA-binding transcriptional regulator [Actinomycetota bacterium]